MNLDPVFIEDIQKWVSYNNKITGENEKIKKLKDEKNKITNNITLYMKKNNMEDTTINIGNGLKIKYMETNTQTTLTFKFLEECLNQYFNNNEEETKKLISFIKNKREIKTETNLKLSK